MTKPADMTDVELADTFTTLCAQRRIASPARRIVPGRVMDALLDEWLSRDRAHA